MLDVVVPKNPPYPRDLLPVILFVHGGAWQRGDKAGRLSNDLAPTLAENTRSIVVLINYRLSPEVQYPLHIHDAILARKWIHENIQQYGGDKDRVVWIGHSAGAHIVMKMFLNDTSLLPQPRGIVGISGVYNIVRMANASMYGGMVIKPVFGGNAGTWREASIMQPNVKVRQLCPILLLNASDDFHLQEDSQELQNWFKDQGHVDVDHYVVNDTNHLSIIASISSKKDSKTTDHIVNFIKRNNWAKKMDNQIGTAMAMQEETQATNICVSVINAMDGITYNFDMSYHSTGNILRQNLVVATGIPTEEQILLIGPPYARFDPKKTIESYQLYTSSKFIFVYDRRTLSQESPTFPRTILQPQSYEVPSLPPTSTTGKPLYESSSPLLRALYEFENQFHLDAITGQTLDNVAQARIAACDDCLKQQKAQAAAIQAAMANLDTFHIAMTDHFQPFWKDYQKSCEHHEELLTNLEMYIERLEDIPLHPLLQKPPHKTTLFHCIPLERVREWRTQCEQSHGHLQSKMEALAASYHALTGSIRNGLATTSNGTTPTSELLQQRDALAAKIFLSESLSDSLQALAKKLQGNHELVVKRVTEAIPANTTADTNMTMSFMYASTNILEACRDLDELNRDQSTILPFMYKVVDEELKEFMTVVAEGKDAMFPILHSQLRWISQVQSDIRDFEQTLSLLKDALHVQKRQFAELDHVAKLPEAYEACLVEIQRRLQYGRLFTWKIQEMGEKLAQMREDEVSLRESFVKEFGQHLPRDFIPGLAEKPSHCDIRMRPFDINLPAIESPNSVPFEIEPNEADLLKQRCKELEARVEELQSELEDQKKASCHCSSFSNSSSMSYSTEKGPNFPMVLALAATAGHTAMNNSSELLDKSSSRMEVLMEEQAQEHEAHILELENRLASQEATLMQAVSDREAVEHKLANTQFLLGSQRSALKQLWNIVGLDDQELDPQSVEGLQKCLDAFEDMWLAKQDELKAAKKEATEIVTNDEQSTKIAFRSFEFDDLALFLPTFAPSDVSAPKVYLAFHLGCPNRFLSDESISTFYQTQNQYPEYILGRIVFIDERVATERDNPYRLILGTTFYVLTVTCLIMSESEVLKRAKASDASEARPIDQFDREFQKYNSKHNALSSTALTLARTELSKTKALLWQDEKLLKEKKEGTLTDERREYLKKRVTELEAALDAYHHSVASSNVTRAALSFVGLVVFLILLFFLNQKVPMF
ncbi:hypothetical protein THRCLA_11581 [Thraustotheca clavata]|uniref:Uncharacterized protein n=1 Tax=Thraustotheca clavata TaxID=74557 RepID=A0A1V9Y798_9STRA|nr:hypothetical protein THRCLA_11581 [Thraustotheca clavata]